ncbi:bifunctional [glutamine synthetase] adenylyltransferase/[glutamine synthetase]-adenylyl-L-tyrosine phosphorylase [Ahrensia sp. R2A130]|uniref:bifunctional [glutamine synthetase] adenylyltransferase/[glutamine synthetase]-adenylyl-L-tyrosine phosphorylase n=1 Tax=Ahrensia sp. R2A130 TaxID=744979 RepID=UPI0001E0E8D7|nr:bifunctional [glutamine synthetase] adenylyltransferase/[glutamine synthetase]-adenylyl-L-tyrosine phosphorylase [Ahrensia sp. R2A130]EFL88981.1 glutamate-ammonia-ligase adenylyltransferase [Ahrensia sp. R2A130]
MKQPTIKPHQNAFDAVALQTPVPASCLASKALSVDTIQRLDALVVEPDLQQFLKACCSCSPYLSVLMERHPDIIALCQSGFSTALDATLEQLSSSAFDDLTDVAKSLRLAKQRGALLIALADLGGWWSALQVGEAMTRLADACVTLAVRTCLYQAHLSGRLALPDPAMPELDCGLTIIAMGKHGARELNYSSDIDLIAFIDPHAPAISDPDEAVSTFTRIIKALVKLMQERTADGYVFRTDLRLRPDPGAMPLAVPVETAMIYYEARGQNWERAAMIKAAAIAGDAKLGAEVLDRLQPFVWRRYLDYAAIADVQSIMRQIRSHRDLTGHLAPGHNVKLGRGGIREIEFFVQTQQLIAGGRNAKLRGLRTVEMLRQLRDDQWVIKQAAHELEESYQVLRDIEHRLQIVNDEQTHILPVDDAARTNIAALCGFQNLPDFDDFVESHLLRVEQHCSSLFSETSTLAGETGTLSFTGDEADPATIETLSGLGFQNAGRATDTIRNWHFGRIPATADARERAALTELAPLLLETLGNTDQPDQMLSDFDGFLSNLGSGSQFFSLLRAQPRLLELLVTILSTAPRMAQIATRRPHVFDGMLEPGFFETTPGPAQWREMLSRILQDLKGYEDGLDRMRVFAAEQRFLLAARALSGHLDLQSMGAAFSDLADTLLLTMTAWVKQEFVQQHGEVPGSSFGWLAMGNLGSRALTAASDLDLIALYRFDSDRDHSDGPRPLHASQYFGRFTQRIVAAMSAATGQGVLYEIDMRLRPDGSSGPVATSLQAFERYHENNAWTWEKLALSRARPLLEDDDEFLGAISQAVQTALGSNKTSAELKADVLSMRLEMDAGRAPKSAWDVKRAAGGLIDVEFIEQAQALLAVRSEKLDISEAGKADLETAGTVYRDIVQLLRLCVGDEWNVNEQPIAVQVRLLKLFDLPDLGSARTHLKRTTKSVRKIFKAALA